MTDAADSLPSASVSSAWVIPRCPNCDQELGPPSTFYENGRVLAVHPSQQDEILGRILDPVRAKALHEAVHTFPYLPESVSDDPVGEILAIAERFEGYLDPTGDAPD